MYGERVCAGGFCFALWGIVYPGWWQTAFAFGIEAGGAMANNEQAEGAGGAEAASSKKGKLKLIIAAAGFVANLGAGAGWVFLMRGHGQGKRAAKPPAK